MKVLGSASFRRMCLPAVVVAVPLHLPLQASSPDEEALVQGAAYLGYKLLSRTTETVVVEVQGGCFRFDVLATLEFNSDRKRMSIIVRTPTGKLLLMCKGADSIIYERLAPNEPGRASAAEHLVSRVALVVVWRACLGMQSEAALVVASEAAAVFVGSHAAYEGWVWELMSEHVP